MKAADDGWGDPSLERALMDPVIHNPSGRRQAAAPLLGTRTDWRGMQLSHLYTDNISALSSFSLSVVIQQSQVRVYVLQ